MLLSYTLSYLQPQGTWNPDTPHPLSPKGIAFWALLLPLSGWPFFLVFPSLLGGEGAGDDGGVCMCEYVYVHTCVLMDWGAMENKSWNIWFVCVLLSGITSQACLQSHRQGHLYGGP